MTSIFFEEHEPELSQDEWIAAGKPKMYRKFYSDGTVVAWDETAYGGLMLQVGDITEEGESLVQNGPYIALGYYYTSANSCVYKRISKR